MLGFRNFRTLPSTTLPRNNISLCFRVLITLCARKRRLLKHDFGGWGGRRGTHRKEGNAFHFARLKHEATENGPLLLTRHKHTSRNAHTREGEERRLPPPPPPPPLAANIVSLSSSSGSSFSTHESLGFPRVSRLLSPRQQVVVDRGESVMAFDKREIWSGYRGVNVADIVRLVFIQHCRWV